jgi:GGDEF domain-containing protein
MLREIEAVRSSRVDDADRARRPLAGGVERLPAAPIAVAGAMEVAAQLERLLVQSRRQRSVFALLWVSVESVEGGAGALSADFERQVRDEVAQRAFARIRATDRLLRESDRDTCVLLPGGNQAAALRVAARFVRALNGAYRVGDELVRVEVRIGHAACPPCGAQAGELLSRATQREAAGA